MSVATGRRAAKSTVNIGATERADTFYNIFQCHLKTNVRVMAKLYQNTEFLKFGTDTSV